MLLLALAGLSGVAEAAQRAVSTSTLALGVVVPAKLAAGTQGATTLGANATRATTTVSQGNPPVTYTSLLVIKSSTSAAQSTTLRYVSATNLNRVTAATITLGGSAQVVIVNGVVTQSAGSAQALASTASLTLAGVIDKSSAGASITLVLELVTSPTATPGADLVERWTLQIN